LHISIKMKKSIFIEVEIPAGVEMNLEGDEIVVKGKEGVLRKKVRIERLSFEKKGNKMVIGNKASTKREKKMMNTIRAHLKNMIKGVQEKFVYHLKVVFHHFPITVEIVGKKAIIKNFLGEKIPRTAKIPEGAEVKVNKDMITIVSTDKEVAGQASANFETATRIRLRDRRVFQDGIFLTNKAGKLI